MEPTRDRMSVRVTMSHKEFAELVFRGLFVVVTWHVCPHVRIPLVNGSLVVDNSIKTTAKVCKGASPLIP